VSRAYLAAERSGARAVAVTATAFMGMQRATGKAIGLPDLRIAEYPGVITIDSQDTFDRNVRERVFPELMERIREPVKSKVMEAAEPSPRDIICRGDFEDVQEHFLQRMWTDGLPIVPPTLDRIERFLQFTDRDPAEVLGVLLPELREATVWSVAVNGVMAGCRPEYFPILLAVVEAVSDPEFRIQHAGATPGWEPLVIVSGSLVRELHFNYQAGAMRVGSQANTSIGRFLRLFMRNVAGLRNFPGQTDKGTIGMSFNVALAENDEAVTGMGWPPFRVDRGFASDDTVVTVQSVVAISPPIYSGGDKPETQLEFITTIFGSTCGPWTFSGLVYGHWHPLLVMSPVVAKVFADNGWTKDRIRQHLYDSLKIPASTLERYFWHVAASRWKVKDAVDEGTIPALYAASDDPDRLVPMCLKAEWINIVLAGDPGRNQSRAYINNHEQGVPVSRRVVLPARWKDLMAGNQTGPA
jgi:hypothetical protein